MKKIQFENEREHPEIFWIKIQEKNIFNIYSGDINVAEFRKNEIKKIQKKKSTSKLVFKILKIPGLINFRSQTSTFDITLKHKLQTSKLSQCYEFHTQKPKHMNYLMHDDYFTFQ